MEIAFRSDAFRANDAVRGSAKLLNAILLLQAPPPQPQPEYIKPRRGRPLGSFKPQRTNFAIVNVQFQVAAFYGLTPLQLLADSRKLRFAKPRQVAMYLARETGASLPEIGRHFCRDHTTVLHAVRTVPLCPKLCRDMERVRRRLNSRVKMDLAA